MLMDLNAWTRKAAPYLVVVSIRTLHILNGWTLYLCKILAGSWQVFSDPILDKR